MSRRDWMWWSSVWALPLMLPQGLLARARALRLPEAPLPWQGEHCGDGAGLRLAVVGDSTVAGVGAGDQRFAVTGQTAANLARLSGCAVTWRAFGRNGATIADIRNEFVEAALAFRPDIVLLSVGVNDTTAMTPRRRWRSDLMSVAALCRRAGVRTVAVSRLPPMHLFSALPQPLRAFLGLRARLLDDDVLRLAAASGEFDYLDVRFEPRPEFLAVDGYHPSADGCAVWGRALAAGLLDLVPGLSPGRAVRAD